MSIIVLIVNAISILLALMAAIILLRSGGKHEYYYGMSNIQDPLKKTMLRMIFLIMVVSFTAAIFNLVVPIFFPNLP